MRISKPKAKPAVLLLIFVFSILLSLFISYSSPFQMFELKLLDLRYSLRGSTQEPDTSVVIISIDDQSDESTPHRWPWPRSYYAHIIENLEDAGAAVIGVDVIFDQPDKYGADQDDQLAEVLQRYDNIVLTGKLFRTSQSYAYSTLIPPYSKFLSGNTSWGITAIEADVDGFYRRYPLIQTHNDSSLLSFSADIIRKRKSGDGPFKIAEDEDYYFLGNNKIPKHDSFSMLINFAGPAYTYKYYSFDSILDDADFDLRDEFDIDAFDDPGDADLGIPPGLKYSNAFKDKIVLIGATMHELHDNFPTPYLEHKDADGLSVRAEMPGVEIHANAISTILQENYLLDAPFYQQFIILVLLGIFVFLLTRFLHTAVSGILTITLLLFYVFFSLVAFVKLNYIYDITLPTLVVLFSYLGHTIYQYVLTQNERRMLRSAFSHYVPDKVIQQIIGDPEKLSLGGEERVVSVLFCDVAGFTSISEVLKPRELVSLLNGYLTEMTEIILKNDGIIDKFEGDAIMAEFGVPVDFPHHAIASCNAALEMQHKLRFLRASWAKMGKPPLYVRIGINTGEVIAGNMGSRDVFDYTVMGDHVNLGARLESANKFYGTNIMISEFTHARVKDHFHTRNLDLIRVKGKQKPIEVYELIATRKTKFTDNILEMLEFFHEGVEAYRAQRWDKSLTIFEHCLRLAPEDMPSKIYIERCRAFKERPPGSSWDGVTTLTSK